MEVKTGKFYRNGNDAIGGPAVYSPDYPGDSYPWVVPPLGHFKKNGESVKNEGHDQHLQCNLIAELIHGPRPWGEMTDAEKGALLLAAKKGSKIEYYVDDLGWHTFPGDPSFDSDVLRYRIKVVEPVVETVKLYGSNVTWTPTQVDSDERKLTLTIKDGLAVTGTFTNENGDVIELQEI